MPPAPGKAPERRDIGDASERMSPAELLQKMKKMKRYSIEQNVPLSIILYKQICRNTIFVAASLSCK